MDEMMTAVAHWATRLLELAGIGVILIGAVTAAAIYLAQLFRGRGGEERIGDFRSNLGRSILLGLEFLVAADIIGTVAVAPSFSNLGVLALIVAIRTFLSFSLELEISGRWPWQHPAPAGPERAPGPAGAS